MVKNAAITSNQEMKPVAGRGCRGCPGTGEGRPGSGEEMGADGGLGGVALRPPSPSGAAPLLGIKRLWSAALCGGVMELPAVIVSGSAGDKGVLPSFRKGAVQKQ